MLTDSTTYLWVEKDGVDTGVERSGATVEDRATGCDDFRIDGLTVYQVHRIEGFKSGHFVTGSEQI